MGARGTLSGRGIGGGVDGSADWGGSGGRSSAPSGWDGDPAIGSDPASVEVQGLGVQVVTGVGSATSAVWPATVTPAATGRIPTAVSTGVRSPAPVDAATTATACSSIITTVASTA